MSILKDAVAKKKVNTGFAARLFVLRQASGMSQVEVAAAAGLKPQNYGRIERGEQTPGWALVIKLSRVLGVKPNDFLPPEGES